jgi:hypothetical protein
MSVVTTRLWATPIPDGDANGPAEPGMVPVELPPRYDMFVQASFRFIRACRSGAEGERAACYLEMEAAARQLERTGEAAWSR